MDAETLASLRARMHLWQGYVAIVGAMVAMGGLFTDGAHPILDRLMLGAQGLCIGCIVGIWIALRIIAAPKREDAAP